MLYSTVLYSSSTVLYSYSGWIHGALRDVDVCNGGARYSFVLVLRTRTGGSCSTSLLVRSTCASGKDRLPSHKTRALLFSLFNSRRFRYLVVTITSVPCIASLTATNSSTSSTSRKLAYFAIKSSKGATLPVDATEGVVLPSPLCNSIRSSPFPMGSSCKQNAMRTLSFRLSVSLYLCVCVSLSLSLSLDLPDRRKLAQGNCGFV